MATQCNNCITRTTLSHQLLPQCRSCSRLNFQDQIINFTAPKITAWNSIFQPQPHKAVPYRRKKGVGVFLIFVVCQQTAFWQQHKYALFSPIFLLSTFFAIFLSFISSSVIFLVYLSCTLSSLFPVLFTPTSVSIFLS